MKKIISSVLIMALICTSVNMQLLVKPSFAEDVLLSVGNTVININELQVTTKDTGDIDEDGLYDGAERVLGTNLMEKDSDGDGLEDLFELENGLNPKEVDSNFDGLNDYSELLPNDDTEEIDINIDTDNDGLINTYDLDNDGDGVPDSIDISPFTYVATNEKKEIKVTTRGNDVIVKIQIAPSQLDNLYKNHQVMNWPVDKYGQITDVDDTQDDLKTVPMLQVHMTELPSEEIARAYGYIIKQASNNSEEDSIWVPLNYLEHLDNYVGLEASIVVEKNTGKDNGDETYTQDITFELLWVLNVENDRVAQSFTDEVVIEYFNEDEEDYERITFDKSVERLIDIDLRFNDKEEMGITYKTVKNYKTLNNGYSGLLYKGSSNSYRTDKWNSVYQIKTGKSESVYDHRTKKRTLLKGCYDFEYNWKDFTHYEESDKGIIVSYNHSGEEQSFELEGIHYTSIQDTAAKFDGENNVLWYLIDLSIEDDVTASKDQKLVLVKASIDNGNTVVERFEVEKYTKTSGFVFKDGLDINFLDYKNDGKRDLLITDRKGYMFLYPDLDTLGFVDRKIMLPDRRDTSNVLFQKTQVLDYNKDGVDDIVSILAKVSEGEGDQVGFALSFRNGIETSNETIATQYEGFNIVGIQAEEKIYADTMNLMGDNESVLRLAATLEELYVNSKVSQNDAVTFYEENFGVNFEKDRAIYGNTYEAMFGITEKIGQIKSLKSSKIKPLIVMVDEKVSYKSLMNNGLNEGTIKFDFKDNEEVLRKNLILKWVKKGQFLSATEIKAYVDDNPDVLPSLDDDKTLLNNELLRLNIGSACVVQVGDDFDQAVHEYILIKRYVLASLPGKSVTGIVKVFYSSPPPISYTYDQTDDVARKFARYQSITKAGRFFSRIGYGLDLAQAIHSGVIYGMDMAEVAGTGFGITTGVTYGFLLLAQSGVTYLLIGAGPVGWVVLGIMALDGVCAYLIDGYDSVVGLAITSLMGAMFEVNQYPGTILRRIKVLDYERLISGDDNGYILGSKEYEELDIMTLIRGATKDTPANTYDRVASCYAAYNQWIESDDARVTHDRDRTLDDAVYDEDDYFYKKRVYKIENTIEFNEVGMNISVDRRSKLTTRLIEDVAVNRYLVYDDDDFNYKKEVHYTLKRDYYDIIPRDIEMLKYSFNMVKEDRAPLADNNEIAYIDYDGDGLYIHGDTEIAPDGTLMDSDPMMFDTDGDGLSDFGEYKFASNPRVVDSDGDGLSDLEERSIGTNPNEVDTDGDGLSDYEETKVGQQIPINIEGETLNAVVYSNPLLKDTDKDGISDDKEKINNLNPDSKQTHGQIKYDLNHFEPSIVNEIDHIKADAGEKVLIDLTNLARDKDGDELTYRTNKGEMKNRILTYDYTGENQLEEIIITIDDGRNGMVDTCFRVGNTATPFVEILEGQIGDLQWQEQSIDQMTQDLHGDFSIQLTFNKKVKIVEGHVARNIVIFNDQFKTSCQVEVIDDSLLVIKPKLSLPFDGSEFTFRLGNVCVTDYSGTEMADDYELTFKTSDFKAPEIKEVSNLVSGSQPLTITFTEAINYSGHYLDVENMATGEIITLDTKKNGSNSIVTESPIYKLDTDTQYKVVDNGQGKGDLGAYVSDKFGNDYLPLGENLSLEKSTFTTSGFAGPRSKLVKTFAFGQNMYGTTMSGTQIDIEFDKPIFEGEDFGDIVLHLDRAITFWAIPNLRQTIIENSLPYEASVKGHVLTIKPLYDKPLDGYALFLPAKSVVDSEGNPIILKQEEDDLLMNPVNKAIENLQPMLFRESPSGYRTLSLPSVPSVSEKPSVPSVPEDFTAETLVNTEVNQEGMPPVLNTSEQGEIFKGFEEMELENIMNLESFKDFSLEEIANMDYRMYLSLLGQSQLGALLKSHTAFDESYEVVYVRKNEINKPTIVEVKAMETDKFDDQVKSLLERKQVHDYILPSRTLMLVMSKEVSQGSLRRLEDIQIHKINGTSKEKVLISRCSPLSNASAGIGSYAIMIELESSLELDTSYEVNMPARTVAVAGISTAVENDLIKYSFETGRDKAGFSSGKDMNIEAFYSNCTPGSSIYVDGKYKNYIELNNEKAIFFWYISDNKDFKKSKLVKTTEIGVFQIEEEHIGKYIFVATLMPTKDHGNIDYVSPPLGPIVAESDKENFDVDE